MSLQASLNEQALSKIPAALFYRRIAKKGDHRNFVGQMNYLLTQKISNSSTAIDEMSKEELERFSINCQALITRKIKEYAGERVAIINTLAVKAYGKDGRSMLMGVMFERFENEVVRCSVYSGRSGSEMTKFGILWISREELKALPEDQHNDMVFTHAAMEMMGLTICGTAN